MEIWIFANGEINQYACLGKMIPEKVFIIAADGGLKHIRKLKLVPDIVIGDLDSISKNDLNWIKQHDIKTEQRPVSKDETDLELAILHAANLKPIQIRIAGALGGRTDQLLGNLFLLSRPELAEIDIRLEDGDEEIFIIRKNRFLNGAAGDIVSLIPISKLVENISTSGLQYALNNETLYRERTRGISNLMIAPNAEIRIGWGILLCVHSHFQL